MVSVSDKKCPWSDWRYTTDGLASIDTQRIWGSIPKRTPPIHPLPTPEKSILQKSIFCGLPVGKVCDESKEMQEDRRTLINLSRIMQRVKDGNSTNIFAFLEAPNDYSNILRYLHTSGKQLKLYAPVYKFKMITPALADSLKKTPLSPEEKEKIAKQIMFSDATGFSEDPNHHLEMAHKSDDHFEEYCVLKAKNHEAWDNHMPARVTITVGDAKGTDLMGDIIFHPDTTYSITKSVFNERTNRWDIEIHAGR